MGEREQRVPSSSERRKEINRQSARRVRKKKTEETASLRSKVGLCIAQICAPCFDPLVLRILQRSISNLVWYVWASAGVCFSSLAGT